MSIDLQGIYKARERIVARQVGDQMLLVPISGEMADLQRVFTLNAVAEFVWGRLDGERTLADICREIASEFEVDADDAQRDALELLAELQAQGLVETDDGLRTRDMG
jgi:hypothetical protein